MLTTTQLERIFPDFMTNVARAVGAFVHRCSMKVVGKPVEMLVKGV